MSFFKKKTDSEKPTELILPEDQWIKYNGCNVHWFIGDGMWQNEKYVPSLWHAWGSCNGRAYQMHGLFSSKTRRLYNITVNSDRENYYFHEPTFNLLTAEKHQP